MDYNPFSEKEAKTIFEKIYKLFFPHFFNSDKETSVEWLIITARTLLSYFNSFCILFTLYYFLIK